MHPCPDILSHCSRRWNRTDPPRLMKTKLTGFQTYATLKERKKERKKKRLFFLKNICHVFPCRNESCKTKPLDYCWVITQVVGRSCSGWSGHSVLEFGFQLESIVYTFRTADQMYTQFQLVQNLSCGQSSRTQLLRQLGNVCTCLKPCCHCEWPY